MIIARIMVFSLFIISLLPLSLLSQADYYGHLKADYYIAAWSLANFTTCAHPLIYWRFSSVFRDAVKQLLSCNWDELRPEVVTRQVYEGESNYTYVALGMRIVF